MPVHGATCWGWLSPRGRILSRAGIGVLSWFIPPGLVDDAVGDGLAWEMRLRSLPARLGVYFVLGCALLSAEPYGEVMRQVTAGLDGGAGRRRLAVPASTALSQGAGPARGTAAGVAVPAGVLGAVAGPGALVAPGRAAGGGGGRDHHQRA